jgi:hypothetical protein
MVESPPSLSIFIGNRKKILAGTCVGCAKKGCTEKTACKCKLVWHSSCLDEWKTYMNGRPCSICLQKIGTCSIMNLAETKVYLSALILSCTFFVVSLQPATVSGPLPSQTIWLSRCLYGTLSSFLVWKLNTLTHL